MDTKQPAVEYKLEKKAVNSKPLFNMIHEFIDDSILTNQVMWGNDIHRLSFVEVVDDYLLNFQERNEIDQFNVICDLRNNSIASMDKGVYVFEVAYRQVNCLNTTRLIYTVKDLLIKSLTDLLDFDLTPTP